MLDTDPPRHTRLRALVNRGFTPAGRGGVREPPARADDAHPRPRAADAASSTSSTTSPPCCRSACCARSWACRTTTTRKLIEWGDAMIGSTDPDLSDISYEHPDERPVPAAAVPQPGCARGVPLRPRARRRAARATRGDDIVTKLVEAEIDGERLTEQEFDAMFLLLVVAGNETTRQAIAHGMQAFMDFPEELERLRADPALMPTRGRGDPALVDAGAALPPHRHPRRGAARDADRGGRQGGHLVCVGQLRRARVRRPAAVRRRPQAPTTTSASAAAARTSASARTWRSSRSGSCSRSCSRGSRRSSRPARRGASAPTSPTPSSAMPVRVVAA